MTDEVRELRQVVAALQREVGRLSGESGPVIGSISTLTTIDIDNIRKLQYTYGYYLDKCLYKEVGSLNRSAGGYSTKIGADLCPSATSGRRDHASGS